ncbi:MAG: PEGA domain-containing protein, partial [Myxococcota bacterium]
GSDGTAHRRKLLVVVAFLALSAPASAQDARFVVLRTGTAPEVPGASSSTRAVETALAGERSVLSNRQALQQIHLRHSSEAGQVSPDDFDALAQESEEALVHVAVGRRGRAQESVERILRRAESTLEALNRQADSARQVQDSCLYLVRALYDGRDRAAASRQALECARLVPDLTPTTEQHPPEIVELYEEAQRRLREGPHGTLRVRSQPSGCEVYLNGRRLGQTPFERSGLPTGEYRVQAECGTRPGRVHRVILATAPFELLIRERFDRALQTNLNLHLRYPTPEEEQRFRYRDAREVASIVSAQQLLLVTAIDASAVRVDHVDVSGDVVRASVVAPIGPGGMDRGTAASVVATLLAGDSADLRPASAGEIEPWVPFGRTRTREPAVPEREAPVAAVNGLEIAGWILGGVGVASLVASWVMQGWWFELERRVDVAEPIDIDFQDRIDARDSWRTVTLVVGASGAALTTAALPLVLGNRGPEWWHWVIAGVGAISAGVGIALAAIDGQVGDDGERTRTLPLGGVLIATGVPMMSLPISALLRYESPNEAGSSSEVHLGTTVRADGGGLHVYGTF